MSTLISIRTGLVAVIRLNRPEKFNSFNREMALELQNALDDAALDTDVRAIYITGEGKAFCAGQDLSEAIDDSGPGIEKIVFEHYNPIIKRIRSIEKPIICGVNGVAAGAGANIALACDIIIAARSATFIQAFSKIGLIPDSGGTFILPRLVGLQRATALMMTGDKLNAEDALSWGLISDCCNDDELQVKGMEMAARLAAMPTIGLGLTKRLLNSSFTNSYTEQLEEEGKLQVLAAATDDYREGVNAFLEKRKPVFTGK
jgi:2-(1,2-epoxy-1,2-dihydrophenyl)acetyl-CoA isomerase